MSALYWLCLVLAVAVAAYLVWALLRAEEF
jgi:K+-transporting ATPase KdpF subunit